MPLPLNLFGEGMTDAVALRSPNTEYRQSPMCSAPRYNFRICHQYCRVWLERNGWPWMDSRTSCSFISRFASHKREGKRQNHFFHRRRVATVFGTNYSTPRHSTPPHSLIDRSINQNDRYGSPETEPKSLLAQASRARGRQGNRNWRKSRPRGVPGDSQRDHR